MLQSLVFLKYKRKKVGFSTAKELVIYVQLPIRILYITS